MVLALLLVFVSQAGLDGMCAMMMLSHVCAYRVRYSLCTGYFLISYEGPGQAADPPET